MKTLIIVRHGNTFEKGEPSLRAGARTDLPLTARGREQGEEAGDWLAKQGWTVDRIVSGPLKRHTESARLIQSRLSPPPPLTIDPDLTEVDYGPDEGLTEDLVEARIGREAIKLWNQKAIVPDGWAIDPDQIRRFWRSKLDDGQNDTEVLVTSNGIARFLLLELFEEESEERKDLKLKTGGIGIVSTEDGETWTLGGWNVNIG